MGFSTRLYETQVDLGEGAHELELEGRAVRPEVLFNLHVIRRCVGQQLEVETIPFLEAVARNLRVRIVVEGDAMESFDYTVAPRDSIGCCVSPGTGDPVEQHRFTGRRPAGWTLADSNGCVPVVRQITLKVVVKDGCCGGRGGQAVACEDLVGAIDPFPPFPALADLSARVVRAVRALRRAVVFVADVSLPILVALTHVDVGTVAVRGTHTVVGVGNTVAGR